MVRLKGAGHIFYRWVVAAGGSFVIALLGVYWLLIRSGIKFFDF
jgi:hypothetical protein